MTADPHGAARVLHAGAPLGQARAAMVLVHGRGADAADILQLGRAVGADDVALLAPEAVGFTWYPQRFIAPLHLNEPHLTSALATVGRCVALATEAGIPRERTVLLGFSQGACLALEYAVRNPARYGGVVALSGGLIGPPGVPREDGGSLDGTPVFLGCSDVDPHIPLAVVQTSTAVVRRMGAVVDERIYPGMGHTVVDDEIAAVRAMLRAIAA